MIRSLAVSLVLLVSSWATAAEITLEKTDGKVVVRVDGDLFTEYLPQSGAKPILWPILGPSGKRMTRDFPMKNTPGEAQDHSWHRSMWFSHGNVDNLDFWTDDQKEQPVIRQREIVAVEEKPQPKIVTRNDWLAPDGKRLCEDERTMSFGADAKHRWIDFDITLRALDEPVIFGDTKEGSFGLRMAETIRGEANQGGKIITSEGKTDIAAWGTRSPWADYHGPVDGEVVGIAILNHPSSFRFPTYWHVRPKGLFAANPFGVNEFTHGTQTGGAYTIEPGQAITLRYRVLLHRGDEKQGGVAEAYAKYAAEP